ncbi:MAG TPA: hypothetical protein VJS45_14990 [Acidimicrobiia bacterium]|nr:hypothetical protein [Acidimicrobiia bacterium]
MAVTTLGADAVFMLNAVNITPFIDSVTSNEAVDTLDVTTFGQNGHRKRGGLTDGSFSIGGVYDTTASGPRDVVKPLKGTIVAFDWRPEGTGTGLPKSVGNVLVQNYVESAPVADIVRWTATLEVDGDITDSNQA